LEIPFNHSPWVRPRLPGLPKNLETFKIFNPKEIPGKGSLGKEFPVPHFLSKLYYLSMDYLMLQEERPGRKFYKGWGNPKKVGNPNLLGAETWKVRD